MDVREPEVSARTRLFVYAFLLVFAITGIAHLERYPFSGFRLFSEVLYGELGIAYAKLGEREKAIAAFREVIELNPKTAYSERAEREIAALKAK